MDVTYQNLLRTCNWLEAEPLNREKTTDCLGELEELHAQYELLVQISWGAAHQYSREHVAATGVAWDLGFQVLMQALALNKPIAVTENHGWPMYIAYNHQDPAVAQSEWHPVDQWETWVFMLPISVDFYGRD